MYKVNETKLPNTVPTNWQLAYSWGQCPGRFISAKQFKNTFYIHDGCFKGALEKGIESKISTPSCLFAPSNAHDA